MARMVAPHGCKPRVPQWSLPTTTTKEGGWRVDFVAVRTVDVVIGVAMGVAGGGSAAAARSQIRLRVVIGCGGIRPVATIPLIEFLDRQGVAIDEIIGCSGGGVVASLYGAGFDGRGIRATIAELLQRRLFTEFNATAPLTLLRGFGRGGPGTAMIRPYRIQAMFRQVFGERRLEDLPRRLLLQATHFRQRSGVVLRQGPLADALYASTAAYPLLPPIRIDGQWLCDGAFSAPLPLAAGQGLADLTLAVTVNASPKAHLGDRLLGFPAELELDAEAMGPRPRLMLLRMPIDRRISWWDTHRIPELFAAGERAAAQHAAAICAALEAASNGNLRDVVARERGLH